MNKFCSYLLVVCCIALIFSCNKEFSVETGAVAAAEGSLWDSAGNCLPNSVHGTFYNGIVAGSDTAFVEMQVNVTQTGSYSIESDIQNGFQFFDSGFFSNTGANTIRLKSVGAAILPNPTTFLINFDSSFCTFTINVQDSTGTGLGGDSTGTGDPDSAFAGNWQFSTDEGNFVGIFDSVAITDTLGYKYAFMFGRTLGTDSLFTFFLSFPGGNIAEGIYEIQQPLPVFNGFQLSLPTGDPIYVDITDETSPETGGQIEVTSYNTSTQVISGTFEGIARHWATDSLVNASNGSFTATLP